MLESKEIIVNVEVGYKSRKFLEKWIDGLLLKSLLVIDLSALVTVETLLSS